MLADGNEQEAGTEAEAEDGDVKQPGVFAPIPGEGFIATTDLLDHLELFCRVQAGGDEPADTSIVSELHAHEYIAEDRNKQHKQAAAE